MNEVVAQLARLFSIGMKITGKPEFQSVGWPTSGAPWDKNFRLSVFTMKNRLGVRDRWYWPCFILACSVLGAAIGASIWAVTNKSRASENAASKSKDPPDVSLLQTGEGALPDKTSSHHETANCSTAASSPNTSVECASREASVASAQEKEHQISLNGAMKLYLALRLPEETLRCHFASESTVNKLMNDIENALKRVTTLRLSNAIGSESLYALAVALTTPDCSVKDLIIEENDIGSEGASALAKALQHPNSKITQLRLGKNNIGSKGAKALARALKDSNCKVTTLYLEENNIDDGGAVALAGALQSPNCKLIELDLWKNSIGDAGAAAFTKSLMTLKCKVSLLTLDRNEISTEQVNFMRVAADSLWSAGKAFELSIDKQIPQSLWWD